MKVVIIGAGIGGLTFGACCARDGHEVIVIDKNKVPGGVLALATFAKVLLVDRLLLGNETVTMTVALVVCLTIAFTVLVAKIVGASLPMLADKLGFDPAVMASPFITTIVDALSLLLYFAIASTFLGI